MATHNDTLKDKNRPGISGLGSLLGLTLALALTGSPPAGATGGIEGTFEYAFDAPWRMEPFDPGNNEPEYGPIPIQLTIHDADLVDQDTFYLATEPQLPDDVSSAVGLVKICRITVEEPFGMVTEYSFDDLAEVEATFDSWYWPTGGAAAPQNEICRGFLGEDCSPLQDLSQTSEWHAVLWHEPVSPANPGSALDLTVEAVVTRLPSISCEQAVAGGLIDIETLSGHTFKVPPGLTLRNHLRVYFGDRPLPRFGDGWLYGDLHYHSQGTDNEGESGYSHRGVVRAMGAMGLDFVMATEHASNSEQMIDSDISIGLFDVDGNPNGNVLRDMSRLRFNTLHERIHGIDGVNDEAALEAGGGLPQGVLSHGVVPRVFLGGEIDVIPENAPGTEHASIPYGNGLTFYRTSLCGGWNSWDAAGGPCPLSSLTETAEDGVLYRDVQGINSIYYGREHLVYLPASGDVELPGEDAPPGVEMCLQCPQEPGPEGLPDGCEPVPCAECELPFCQPQASLPPESYFVRSNTTEFGGASRRLSHDHQGQPAMLPELEEKGYAFIAHPLNASSGSQGPALPPWTEHMFRQAWRSKSILGLQLWNENARRESGVDSNSSNGSPGVEIGYYRDEGIEAPKPVDDVRSGFLSQAGLFELDPWDPISRRWGESSSQSKIFALDHGTYTWDKINHWGLELDETAQIGWLALGEPRRFLMAGGSDAHGDLNYRREGYLLGTDGISDTAIGSPRNLVHVGPGQVVPIDGLDSSDYPEAHEHGAVVDSLVAGRFTVTDGPAVRIVIDRNRNQVIDQADIPMGGWARLYGDTELPLLVEWLSTEEFGAVANIDLYVGVQKENQGRTYAPWRHGPRSDGSTPGLSSGIGYQAADGMLHELQDDEVYWHVTRTAGTDLRISGGSADAEPMCTVVTIQCGDLDTGDQVQGPTWKSDDNPCQLHEQETFCSACDVIPADMLQSCDPLATTTPGLDTPLPDDVFYGIEARTLDLAAFEAAEGVGADRFFVRAFARTHVKMQETGGCDNRLGDCIERFAYTNPVWAVSWDTAGGECPADPQAIDSDGDGLPDGCDPCPTMAGESCLVAP